MNELISTTRRWRAEFLRTAHREDFLAKSHVTGTTLDQLR